jgi:hypothetical protein
MTSHDTEDVLSDKLKNNSFSIQVDESTDFTNKSYVVAFVKKVKLSLLTGREGP